MGESKIPWLKNPDGSQGKTWPLAEGCTKVSSGCMLCCAERVFNHWHPGDDFSQLRLKPQHLEVPLHWKKPQRILVDFMFDLFHPEMPTWYVNDIFASMAACPQHTFMILTKRAAIMDQFMMNSGHGERVAQSLEKIYAGHGWCPPDFIWPLPNVWLGVSVEDQATANERIPPLMQTLAAVRFISYEPALGSLNLENIKARGFAHRQYDVMRGVNAYENSAGGAIFRDLPTLDWVICGCESGSGARPMDIEWARLVKDQCEDAGVPFFFKQQMVNGTLIHMPELDGKVWAQMPEIYKTNAAEKE